MAGLHASLVQALYLPLNILSTIKHSPLQENFCHFSYLKTFDNPPLSPIVELSPFYGI